MASKFRPGIVVKLLRTAGWTSSIAKQLYVDAEVRVRFTALEVGICSFSILGIYGFR